MIVDSSAVMAILLGEEQAELFARTLATAHRNSLSAGNWIELAAVLTRRKRDDLLEPLDRLMLSFGVAVVPITTAQGELGHHAYRRYGVGSGHAARLNFGDCFAYALAIETGEPLLFKGEDFVHTDVLQALPR